MEETSPDGGVTLRWTLEREDFVEAVGPTIRQRMRHPALVVVQIGAVLLAGALVFIGFGDWPPASSSIPFLVVVMIASLVAIVLLDWPISTLIAWRQWRSSPRMHEPQEAVLMPGEIRLRSAGMDSTVLWSAFDQVSETSRLYRLHIGGQRSPRMFVVIPKRVLPGTDGSAGLGALLRQYVMASAKRAEPLQTPP